MAHQLYMHITNNTELHYIENGLNINEITPVVTKTAKWKPPKARNALFYYSYYVFYGTHIMLFLNGLCTHYALSSARALPRQLINPAIIQTSGEQGITFNDSSTITQIRPSSPDIRLHHNLVMKN